MGSRRRSLSGRLRRTAPRTLRLLVALLPALALTGCGDGTDAARQAQGDRLEAIRYDGERVVSRRALDCSARDRAACRRIAEVLPELAPDPDEACAEIYGGPERIVLRGRLDGAPVDVEVTRTDACEIARYDRLAAVLPG